jgi:hypothetical protein
MEFITIQSNLKIMMCRNVFCVKITASCRTKGIITMDRYFWEKLLTGISNYKNNEIIKYLSVTLTIGPHQQAPYGF